MKYKKNVECKILFFFLFLSFYGMFFLIEDISLVTEESIVSQLSVQPYFISTDQSSWRCLSQLPSNAGASS